MTTAGLTARGGTGNTVTIIHSGRAYLGSMPRIMSSSSEMRLKISCTRSGLRRIFFSWESSFTCFHSAYSSRPERRIRGWYLPQPPWPLKWKDKNQFLNKHETFHSAKDSMCDKRIFSSVPSLWWDLPRSPAAPLQTCCPSPLHPHKCFCLYIGHIRGSDAYGAAPLTWSRCLWFLDCSG